MKPIIRMLAAVSLGVVALAASAARADEGAWNRHAPPIASSSHPSRPEYASWRGRVGGRDEERAERARRIRELEAARERFYASWDGNQRRQARFEAWYSAQCADQYRRG
jgi:hypothetical protein